MLKSLGHVRSVIKIPEYLSMVSRGTLHRREKYFKITREFDGRTVARNH